MSSGLANGGGKLSADAGGRRGLLAALGRAGGLLLLLAGGGWLMRNRSAGSAGAGAASSGNPCARCASLFSCLLPQAENSRRRGIGLAGPVRRAIEGTKPDAADIGCEEGQRLADDT